MRNTDIPSSWVLKIPFSSNRYATFETLDQIDFYRILNNSKVTSFRAHTKFHQDRIYTSLNNLSISALTEILNMVSYYRMIN